MFGGRLTALRYPERELVSRARRARRTASRRKPFLRRADAPALTAQQRDDELLDIDGRARQADRSRRACRRNVTIREENAIAALEVMGRFAVDPRWLVYLPPTDVAVGDEPARAGLLEHPAEAFAYYRQQGVAQVDLRGEAHGLARGRRRLPRRGRGARAASASRDGRSASATRAPAGAFFDDAALERELLGARAGGARRARACGTRSRPTGSASTAS